MDLFEYSRRAALAEKAPLASRMRPRTLDEVVGQGHILGADGLLARAIRADRVGSLILYGPPGTGKTTLAKVIASSTNAQFRQLNATCAGKKDMEEAVASARGVLGQEGRRTILFIDEIHRFNKAQQDYLLPYVEDGTVILVGATTENPFFEVNRALISRSTVLELKPLSEDDIALLLRRAAADPERGLGRLKVDLDDDAARFLADAAGGDARTALNALEIGALTTDRGEGGRIRITLDVASSCIQKRALGYDRDGDGHYDTVSAFIKSMRGSDPDAAVYYLARMLCAGEDIGFIARRIVVCAAEDVSNADPNALTVAVAAAQAAERVGMPEARIPLAQAAAYVACAPKSNSAYAAIDEAMECVRSGPSCRIPPHLRDAHYSGAEELGRGVGYVYPHDSPNHYVEQQYLPDRLRGRRFYRLSDSGYEGTLKRMMARLGREQRAPPQARGGAFFQGVNARAWAQGAAGGLRAQDA